MGAPMAERLAAVGHEVTVWNRTAARAQEFARVHGTPAAATPREAAQGAELVLTMVADPQAVREVATGDQGLLAGASPGTIWVDSSTIDPDTSRELAGRAQARGVRHLDAPVLGSIPEASSGKLLMVVGGDEKDFQAARPVLERLAREIFYVGGQGQGNQMKLVLNSLLAGFTEVLAEATVLGLKGGLSRQDLQQVIGEAHFASPWLKGKLTRFFEEQGPVNFTLPMMLKDLNLIEQVAARKGALTPSLEAARAEFEQASRSGYAARDYSDIFSFLLKQSGNGQEQ